MGEFKLTAYCPCDICSEGYGDLTATGTRAKAGRTIAVDQDVIPYGSNVVISIDGKTQIYRAEDCGAKVEGKHIDIYFDNHNSVDEFEVKYADVLLRVGMPE